MLPIVIHAIVCPDTIRLPSRSISTSASGMTRKNRHVPCLDRIQSSAVMAASRAMSRSWAISSLNSSVSSWIVARIAGANMTRTNATGIFETIAMSKTCGLLLLRVCVNPSDIEDPLRPAQCHLDHATCLRDRDRFFQRPVRAGAAAHGRRLLSSGVGRRFRHETPL